MLFFGIIMQLIFDFRTYKNKHWYVSRKVLFTDGYIMDNFRKVVGRNDAANTEFSALKNGRVRQAKDKK